MTKEILVIYHAPCLDGFSSAWVAHTVFGENAEYVAATYNQAEELPDVLGRRVYIVDFSYPADIMRDMASKAYSITVLDHHKTAQADLQPLLDDGTVDGVFDMERSGAGITWDWFYPGEERPQFINYVEDRDLWKFTFLDSKAVNMAMFSYDYKFENWNMFATEDGMERLRMEGVGILRKHMKDVHEVAEHAQTINIGGYDVPTVNANYMYGSDIANVLSVGHPFAAYYWVSKTGEFCFGLRSQVGSADVSAIAKLYGGGGHANASGFRVNNLGDL
jgi:oligoribonuclease NrnB/cAMP/cGMP phosphodiesterase (DHH superfamily)